MKKKFLFMIPLCLFIIDYFLIKYQVIQSIDWFIYHLVQNLKCDFMTSFFKLCSTLGSTWFYVILVLTLVILKNKKDIWVGIHLLIIQGMNRIIKALVKRPRPPQIYHLVKETNYSFPSGHSMSAMIGYGLLVLEVQKSSLKYKKVIEIFLMMMIFSHIIKNTITVTVLICDSIAMRFDRVNSEIPMFSMPCHHIEAASEPHQNHSA